MKGGVDGGRRSLIMGQWDCPACGGALILDCLLILSEDSGLWLRRRSSSL